MGKLTKADFPDHACDRILFSKAKRGPKATQWCSWCRAFLRPTTACPVVAITDIGSGAKP